VPSRSGSEAEEPAGSNRRSLRCTFGMTATRRVAKRQSSVLSVEIHDIVRAAWLAGNGTSGAEGRLIVADLRHE
jgi:hypothetical protein